MRSMDYGFAHAGTVYTPNQTLGITPEQNTARNAELERAELARWAGQPDRQWAYFSFPAEGLPLFGKARPYRREFRPCLHTVVNIAPGEAGNGYAHEAIVMTWPGTVIGTITSARVYPHNFGSRMMAITVRGTNGAIYHGRASWDHGQCVNLRKGKAR